MPASASNPYTSDASYCISTRQFVPHHNTDVTPVTGHPTSAPPPSPPQKPDYPPGHEFLLGPRKGKSMGRFYQNRSRDV